MLKNFPHYALNKKLSETLDYLTKAREVIVLSQYLLPLNSEYKQWNINLQRMEEHIQLLEKDVTTLAKELMGETGLELLQCETCTKELGKIYISPEKFTTRFFLFSTLCRQRRI